MLLCSLYQIEVRLIRKKELLDVDVDDMYVVHGFTYIGKHEFRRTYESVADQVLMKLP